MEWGLYKRWYLNCVRTRHWWKNIQVSEWVSECLLLNAKSTAITWWEQVNFQWDDDEVRFVLDQQAELNLHSLAHWNNSLRIDMSLHSDTLFWFRANQFLLFLRNSACLAEEQQIPILLSLVWPNRDSNPRSTAFKPSTDDT